MSYVPSSDYFMSFDTGDFMYSKVPYDGTNKVNSEVCGDTTSNCGTNKDVCDKLCDNMKLSNQYIKLTSNHLGNNDQQSDIEKVYKDQYRKLANTFVSLCLVSFFIAKINNNSI
jgi:hypothetical protein